MSSTPEQIQQSQREWLTAGTKGRTYTSTSWDENGKKTERILGGDGQ